MPEVSGSSKYRVQICLKEERQRKGLTQDELARLAETTQNTISCLEAGQLPNVFLALRLSRALETDLGNIYFLMPLDVPRF